jgi:hypothetical protein
MRMAKDPIVKSPSGRPTRAPVGARNILAVKGQDPDYVYRVCNDDYSRIDDLVERGWEFVQAKDIKVGDSRRIDNPVSEGTKAMIQVGRTKPKTAFVMRIKREWYLEDQQAKQDKVDQLEATMKQQVQSQGGTLDISR